MYTSFTKNTCLAPVTKKSTWFELFVVVQKKDLSHANGLVESNTCMISPVKIKKISKLKYNIIAIITCGIY